MDILDTRENLNAMVLKHEQQIKDIAKHLLELQQYMEFKRREWVGLTEDEIEDLLNKDQTLWGVIRAAEAKLKDKNT